jgi:hypothetical protein
VPRTQGPRSSRSRSRRRSCWPRRECSCPDGRARYRRRRCRHWRSAHGWRRNRHRGAAMEAACRTRSALCVLCGEAFSYGRNSRTFASNWRGLKGLAM